MITAEQDKALRALAVKYPRHPMAKFCVRPISWYAIADRIAGELGLHERTSKHILDIGCGFGYFVKSCCDHGHVAGGIDIPDAMIEEAVKIISHTYTPLWITAHVPLPYGLRGYDTVTTFGVNFKHIDGTYWDHRDYAFLANDIRNRLSPGGRWILRPNQTTDKQHPIANLMRTEWWMGIVPASTSVIITHNQVEIQWT